ncbi:cysteine hydrolase [Clostridium sp. 19966]|uniref:cysteine hydrolase family protein n=1 Tax=Clostridium sp. 19966 TaxID=2768166 RepID=UPI0028DE087C|nr:isochorismatase family cysteine hydrolase [Clostridium sp. 19966]MDT8719153.1 cysteine hydrolase [Clostridium sp. 19966]
MRKIDDRKAFLREAEKTLDNIMTSFENIPVLKAEEFEKKNTALINVDIINGFCKEGNLSSDRVLKIIPDAVRINALFKDLEKVFFLDCHPEKAEEFKAYVSHCIEGSQEVELVDELKPFAAEKALLCKKNSVNGFLAPQYQQWLKEHKDITNIIVIGDVTDICILNFCLAQRCYFNENNISGRVIVPLSAVETFDLDITNHQGDLMNLFSIYNMRGNGIEIVEDII